MSKVSKPVMMIAEALKSAQEQFFDAVFKESDLTTDEKIRAARYIQDPLWRPLCELEVNGLTSFEGGMLLLAAELIFTSSFRVRHGPERGFTVQCVDFTDKGAALFNYYANEQMDGDLKERFINSLTSYALIDSGSGAVAQRCTIESANEINDHDLLKRIRSIPYGAPQFNLDNSQHTTTEKRRSDYLKFVTLWECNRGGAGIIDLGVIYPEAIER